MRRTALAVLLACATTWAQEVTLEYRVKAAYLYNFVRYIEWPRDAIGESAINICVAGRNPFGTLLNDLVHGEAVGGHMLLVRVILEPEPGCHVMFIPRGAAMPAYMKAVGTAPVLTIGETPEFAESGGIITFVVEGSNVRFDINQDAAARAQLQISSRLLRLARTSTRTQR